MLCQGCPGHVPCISLRLTEHILADIPPAKRAAILIATFEWLTRRDEGIVCYEGITGRPYTDQEKAMISLDTEVCASLPCPYASTNDEGCLLGGLGPHYNRMEEANKAPYGWLPTLVARTWDPQTVRDLGKRRAIADVKIAILTRNDGWLSREMVDALRVH
jgi:hypothetical protein